MHYRVGWLVERLSYLESIHLLRQGLDVRSLSAERPARRRRGEGEQAEDHGADAVEATPGAAAAPTEASTSPADAG